MKHISLFALKKDERRIMKALQQNGVVQIERAEISDSGSAAGLFNSACADELAEKTNNVSRIKSALGRLNPYLPKAGLLDALPDASEDELVSAVPGALELCDKLDGLQKKQAVCRGEKEKKAAVIQSLRPLENVTIPLDSIRPTRTASFSLGLISPEKLPELDEAGIMYDAYPGEGRKIAILAAIPNSERDETMAILRSLGFAEASIPETSGIPSETSGLLSSEIASLDLEYSELSKQIQDMGEEAEVLRKGLDGALIEQRRAEARCELFATKETFGLSGWVRSDEADKLASIIDENSSAHYLEMRDPYDDEQPPTCCKNNRFFAPFEFITNMYSPPDPRGFDPTVVMAPFYLLFFGLMMGDTGYGFVMSLGAALYLKLKKPRGGTAQVTRILFWGGLSTMVFGLLTGTFFGMNWYDLFGESFPFPLIDPMKDQMTAIIVYCGLGFGQIIIGMIISIVLHLKAGDWQTALFDIASWLMIFAGAALFFLTQAPVKYIGIGLAALGLLLLIVFGGRAKKGIGRVIGGFGKLYDITGFLSDVLSYSRVFALGLATGAMGSAFNLVAGIARDMLKGIPVVGGVLSFIIAALLLAVLHLFSIAMNALGAFIHCARLQFIEYYNRFYTPGGKLFKPLGINTKYNNVK